MSEQITKNLRTKLSVHANVLFPVEFFKIILHFLFLIPKAFAGKKWGSPV